MKKEATIQKRHRKRRPEDYLRLCQICGDKALNYNFGCITCESCKSFFRRNVDKCKQMQCITGLRDCRITLNNRRLCTYCRMQKCIHLGMHSTFESGKEKISKQTITCYRFPKIESKNSSCGSPTSIFDMNSINIKIEKTLLHREESNNSTDNSPSDSLNLGGYHFETNAPLDYVDKIMASHLVSIQSYLDNPGVLNDRLSVIAPTDLITLGGLSEALVHCIVRSSLDDQILPHLDVRSNADLVIFGEYLFPCHIKFMNRVPQFQLLSKLDQKCLLSLRLPTLIHTSLLCLHDSVSGCLKFSTTCNTVMFDLDGAVKRLFGGTDEDITVRQMEWYTCINKLFDNNSVLQSCLITMKMFEIPNYHDDDISASLREFCDITFRRYSYLMISFLFYLKPNDDLEDVWTQFCQLYRWGRHKLDVTKNNWLNSLELNKDKIYPVIESVLDSVVNDKKTLIHV